MDFGIFYDIVWVNYLNIHVIFLLRLFIHTSACRHYMFNTTNKIHLTNIILMLPYQLRRWSNMRSTLVHRLLFAVEACITAAEFDTQ